MADKKPDIAIMFRSSKTGNIRRIISRTVVVKGFGTFAARLKPIDPPEAK